MADSTKSFTVPKQVHEALDKNESVLLASQLRVPKIGTRGTTFFTISMLVKIFDEFRNAVFMRQLRAQSTSANFALERRMFAYVTERRILLWKMSRFGKLHTYLTAIPRSRIRSVRVPYVSNNPWKVIEINTADGISLILLIDRDSAARFSSELNVDQ